MERKYRKAINFDLDTRKLKTLYPGGDYHAAYYDLRRFFASHGFEHRQGSGYLSQAKLTSADIYDLMDDLSQAFPWLGSCTNKIDVTNISQQHDLLELLRPSAPDLAEALLLQGPQPTEPPFDSVRQSTAKAGE